MNIMKCSLLHKNCFLVSKEGQTLKLLKGVWTEITVSDNFNFLLVNLYVVPDINVKITEDYFLEQQFKCKPSLSDLTCRFEFTRFRCV
jgi:hypothetical protein